MRLCKAYLNTEMCMTTFEGVLEKWHIITDHILIDKIKTQVQLMPLLMGGGGGGEWVGCYIVVEKFRGKLWIRKQAEQVFSMKKPELWRNGATGSCSNILYWRLRASYNKRKEVKLLLLMRVKIPVIILILWRARCRSTVNSGSACLQPLLSNATVEGTVVFFWGPFR
jgi:hypothetical protein